MLIHPKRQRSLLLILLFVIALQACFIARIDRTPYKQASYYKDFNVQLNQVIIDSLQTNGDTLQAGWAKVNITPSYRVPLAGYGVRRGKKFTSVHDSIWVRAFVFDNGKTKAALVTMDLLIVPPEVQAALIKRLPEIGFSISQTYLTATHTHNSIGGWAKKLVGRLIAGKYDKKVVNDITAHILEAIQKANQHKQKAKFGFTQIYARELVNHRITPESSVDSTLTIFKIQQASGSCAAIITFSAHATCLSSSDYALSRDYPGGLVDTLEKSKNIDFASFCAGGVGSHSPAGEGNNYEKVTNMADLLSAKIIPAFDTITLTFQKQLISTQLYLPLRKPQWRISQNWRLRPWLFYSLYGDYPATLTALKVGDVAWIGTPCDFSGELTLKIQKEYKDPLVITSFNGGYTGYITEDLYYDNKHYETRVMNWFGPENGAYFIEAIQGFLNKL